MATRRMVLWQGAMLAGASLLPLSLSRAASPLQEAANAKALRDAIRAASRKFRTEGASFDPFLIKMIPPDAPATTIVVPLNPFIAAPNLTYILPRSDGRFLPLGDTACRAGQAFRGGMLVAPAPGKEEALAHPVGFKNVANGRQMAYWAMIPPPGYKALGICVTDHWSHPPKQNAYWCVADDYVTPTGSSQFWSDEGTGAGDNCNLIVATPPRLASVAEGEMLFLPPTILAEFPGANVGYALRIDKAYLPLAEREPERPKDDLYQVQGDQLGSGLAPVAILPGLAFADLSNTDNPFVFLALRKWWEVQRTTNLHGVTTVEYVVGTETNDARQFREKTGIELGAEVGAEAGGFSAKLTAKFTQEFELTTSSSETHKTQLTEKYEITVPEAKTSAFWQRKGTVSLFGSSGDELARAGYGFNDPRQTNF